MVAAEGEAVSWQELVLSVRQTLCHCSLMHSTTTGLSVLTQSNEQDDELVTRFVTRCVALDDPQAASLTVTELVPSPFSAPRTREMQSPTEAFSMTSAVLDQLEDGVVVVVVYVEYDCVACVE